MSSVESSTRYSWKETREEEEEEYEERKESGVRLESNKAGLKQQQRQS
jgi:hypothetical protein